MGNTPIMNLPYPEDSASVDVPRDIEALARAIDTRLAKVLSSTMPAAAGMVSTTIQAGAQISDPVVVTYPAGRFNVGPALLATAADAQYYGSAIPNGATSGVVRSTYAPGPLGSTVTPLVSWAAIQPSAAPATASAGMFDGVHFPSGLSTVVQPDQPVVVTCRTGGCGNANIPLTVNVYDSANPGAVVCGVCSQPILDITIP